MIITDDPIAGFYRMALRRGAPPSGIRIWEGPPIDPATGDEVPERGVRWQAAANGQPIDLERVWPICAKDPIDENEYVFLAESHGWAVRNDPFDPRATPFRKTDWDTATPPSF